MENKKMLRNFSFKVILVATVLAVFATCSSSANKETPKDGKDAKDASAAKDANTAKDAKTAPAASRNVEGAETGSTSKPVEGAETGSAEKPKVGMRGADESQGKTTASLPDIPPGSKPGQCWIPIVTPATYKELTESVEKRPASEKIDLIPAKYETVEEKVIAKEASTMIETVPAVYETVEEKVVVKPASKQIEQVPAVYETIQEKIIDKEGYTEWRKDTATGIKCLVEVPPTYKSVPKEVLKTPASSREIEIPAEYATVSKQVLKTPATTRTIEIPAEYKTVQVQKLVEPAKEIKTPIPPEMQTITKKVIDQPEKAEWREILCETNITREKMSEIHKALKVSGFDPGTTEGTVGSGTFKALNDYQKARNLPTDDGKHINMITVRSLGVSK
jgi:hypothetical protein